MEDLQALGFTGFRTVGFLRDEAAVSVPAEPGVWLVMRDATGVPHFLARSTAAHWRGRDPSETADALGARWVARASVLYLAAAAGPGVRALLQQRVKRFLRFGMGRNVAHWEGRVVWQLSGATALRLAWKALPATKARAEAERLVGAFTDRYGLRPFANEDEAGDDDQ